MNSFEQQVLADGGGNAQEKLRRLYGKDITYHNAKKYLAGIKMHILKLEEMGAGASVPLKRRKFIPKGNDFQQGHLRPSSGMYLTPEEAASPTSL